MPASSERWAFSHIRTPTMERECMKSRYTLSKDRGCRHGRILFNLATVKASKHAILVM